MYTTSQNLTKGYANDNYTVSGSTYTLTYDAENHLTSVTGAATASFIYDGDGARVKGVVNGVTTIYVGSHYEVSGNVQRKYYYAGNQRIAMREGTAGHLWLFNDHLGSTGYTYNATTKQGELRYRPFGSTRYTWGTTPTSYRYTGQREEASLGIYYYGARWYDPALGRFIQPDTIVPDPADAKAYDRFAYVINNPLKYNDPSGHCYSRASAYLRHCGGTGGIRVAPVVARAAEITVKVAGTGGAVYLANEVIDSQGAYVTPATDVPGSIVLQDPVAYANQVQVTGTPLDSASLPTIPPPSQPVGITTQQLSTPLPVVQPGSNIVYTGGTYPNDVGAWGAQQVGSQLPVDVGAFDVDIQGQTRIYDGRFRGTASNYVEIKTSASTTRSSIEITPRIREEVALDAQMVPKPMWVFVDRKPSTGLITLLNSNQIPWHQLNPQASPPRPR